MKTKAILFIGAVALVTLSFTFVGAKKPAKMDSAKASTSISTPEPIGGLYADVVK